MLYDVCTVYPIFMKFWRHAVAYNSTFKFEYELAYENYRCCEISSGLTTSLTKINAGCTSKQSFGTGKTLAASAKKAGKKEKTKNGSVRAAPASHLVLLMHLITRGRGWAARRLTDNDTNRHIVGKDRYCSLSPWTVMGRCLYITVCWIILNIGCNEKKKIYR